MAFAAWVVMNALNYVDMLKNCTFKAFLVNYRVKVLNIATSKNIKT